MKTNSLPLSSTSVSARERGALALFIILVVIGGMAMGWLNRPSDWVWFEELTKPSFNPPRWVFGPVWTILYIMIGVVGWMVWCKRPDKTLGVLWIVQLILNYSWSPTFFIAHDIDLALGIIIALWLAIVAFIMIAVRRKRFTEAGVFIFYGIWISFATCLNASIYSLNMS